MTRTLTAAVTTESKAAVVHGPVLCVKLEYDSAPVRVCSADRDFVINVDGDGNQTFLGVGRIGSISAMQENTDFKAAGISMSLRGLPSEFISLALSEPYQGRPVKLWVLYLDPSFQVIADPLLAWEGMIDTMNVAVGETAMVTLTAEHELVRWEQPNISRYTNEDQQLQFPGDLGLEFMPNADREFLWGFTPPTPPVPSASKTTRFLN